MTLDMSNFDSGNLDRGNTPAAQIRQHGTQRKRQEAGGRQIETKQTAGAHSETDSCYHPGLVRWCNEVIEGNQGRCDLGRVVITSANETVGMVEEWRGR